MSDQPGETISPVWPELAEVISESPAVILPEAYYIIEVAKREDAFSALMIFDDKIETTAVIPESILSQPPALRW